MNEKYDGIIAEIKHHLRDVLAEESLEALIKIINEHDVLKEKAEKYDVLNEVFENYPKGWLDMKKDLEQQIKQLKEELRITQQYFHDECDNHEETKQEFQSLKIQLEQIPKTLRQAYAEIQTLKEQNKELLFKVQDEALFGMKQVEANSLLKAQLEQSKAIVEVYNNVKKEYCKVSSNNNFPYILSIRMKPENIWKDSDNAKQLEQANKVIDEIRVFLVNRDFQYGNEWYMELKSILYQVKEKNHASM